jgi:hypothetical protein
MAFMDGGRSKDLISAGERILIFVDIVASGVNLRLGLKWHPIINHGNCPNILTQGKGGKADSKYGIVSLLW